MKSDGTLSDSMDRADRLLKMGAPRPVGRNSHTFDRHDAADLLYGVITQIAPVNELHPGTVRPSHHSEVGPKSANEFGDSHIFGMLMPNHAVSVNDVIGCE